MDFGFNEEQQAVAEAAVAIFAGHATPERVAAVEAGTGEASEPRFDRELWVELARANLLGIAVPEEHGGSGLGLIEACILLVAQGRRVAPVPLAPALVSAMAVAKFGTPAQQAALLPGVVSGETVLTVALATGGMGTPAHTAVTAMPTAGGWVLDGYCPMVRAVTIAECILVPARIANIGSHGPGGHGDSYSHEDGAPLGIFLVDPTAAGCSVERVLTTDRQESGNLILSGYEMKGEALIGGAPPGSDAPDGKQQLDWIAERYTVALCALQLGVCEEAVKLAAQYVTTRHQFGKPLASFQGVALRAADAHIDTEAMSVTLWQAAWRLAEGRDAAAEVAVAKWWASEAGHRVVHAAQHLHGGLGADITYPAHRYFLWGKQIELEMGAGAVQLERLGEHLVGAT